MDAWSLLTPAQAAASRTLLATELEARRHLVVALSGAHAYGFPSPDSDVDLKAVHLDPTETFLGLQPRPTKAERLQWIDGIELDYSSNELAGVLAGILQGNGNYLERILGPCTLSEAEPLESLRPLVQRNLSRRLHRHYRGFATSQRLQWDESRRAKKALYVLRTTLTGRHALRTGEIVTDVTQLLDEAGFAEARELVAIKLRGELTALGVDEVARWNRVLDRAFAALDEAVDTSVLPPEPAAVGELEGWLIDLRKAAL
jgi:predicted nucleotidyltransferase